MKQIWKEICFAATMGIIIPAMLVSAAVRWMPRQERDEIQLHITEDSSASEITEPTEAEICQMISVLSPGDQIIEMELEEYLTGVVLAEMPVSFHEEALKAQAVVARTYTVRAAEGRSKHSDAAVCTDSACCQAYMTEEMYREKGGTEDGIERVRSAVSKTKNQVLTYDGKLIEATYFSCSGGSTEDAVAVWGTDVPYLQATDSPGEEEAAHFSDQVSYSPDNFAKALGEGLTGSPTSWIGKITYTSGGGVDTILIGGKEWKGTAVRKALGLRSTAFSISADEKTITITTKGFGHRVGMSQYGADAMGRAGSGYEQILAHYYQGTVLQTHLVDKGDTMG